MHDESWEQRIDRRISALETRTAVDEVHRGTVEKRLSAIEDTLKWLVRLVFGALLAALVAFVAQGGLSGG